MTLDLDAELAERPVVVTGADGFIGSHLVDQLVDAGADVTGFTQAVSSGQLRHIDRHAADIRVVRGDLRDPYSVRGALEPLAEHSDILVFHLGAQAHVGESWERPVETLETNTLGTMHLLEAILDLDLDCAAIDTAGTSEEYGNVEKDERVRHDGGGVVLDERAPVEPTSVYATSKLAADYLTMNYHDAYGLPTVTTRMFNNYGPRQNARYITPTAITQALERDVVELGNLVPKRDLCYVTDGVRGHLHAAIGGDAGEQYVYGYGEHLSMRDWATLILDVGAENGYWEAPTIEQRADRYRPGDSDVRELRVGYAKLHEATGWEPTVDWREGVRRTIDWYAHHRDEWRGQVDWR